MGHPVLMLASGIGMATEYHQLKKARKATKTHNGTNNITSSEGNSRSSSRSSESPVRKDFFQGTNDTDTTIEEDEREWELDDAQDDVVGGGGSEPRKSKNGLSSAETVLKAFLERHPPPPPPANAASTFSRLDFPVVIPQRRPKSKSRGFVRAYAPDLQRAGIDQAMWLDFLESFNEASLANPLIQAINLVSLATIPLSTPIGIAVAIGVQLGAKIASEAQRRVRQNKFLDQANEQFFRPRGLYCLVMTWDPTAKSNLADVDLSTTIQQSMTRQKSMSHKLHSSNGVTSEITMPQTAELVFPGLDYIVASEGTEANGMMDKIKRGRSFVDDYIDRKEQAIFVDENPNNVLTDKLKPSFASKYADPSHPIHNGSLISLISLGRIIPKERQPRIEGDGAGLLEKVSKARRRGKFGNSQAQPLSQEAPISCSETYQGQYQYQHVGGQSSPYYDNNTGEAAFGKRGDGGRSGKMSSAGFSRNKPKGIKRFFKEKVLYGISILALH